MKPKSGLMCALLLLFLATPMAPRDRAPARIPARPIDPVLGTAIEAQLQTVERLAGLKTAKGQPDPRLFGELSRLEEMLPRSAATRRAQERGKRAYIAMATRRSMKLARDWPKLRAEIEREMQSDKQYMRALAALDRRLDADAKRRSAAVSTGVSDVLDRSLRSIGGTEADQESIRHAGAELLIPANLPVARTKGKPGALNRKTSSSKPKAFPFEQLRPGDIMIWDDRSGPPMVRVALALFAQKCTHTALYLGETSSRAHGVQRWILEAQSPALGVRISVLGKKWTRPGLHVSLGHVNGIAPGRAAQLASAAVDAYGSDGRTPYHIWPPWDKTYTQEGLYCSQLLWAVYDKNGVDLDSNDWHYLVWFTVHNWFNPYAAPTAYFAVFPDEIKASPKITWYYDQPND